MVRAKIAKTSKKPKIFSEQSKINYTCVHLVDFLCHHRCVQVFGLLTNVIACSISVRFSGTVLMAHQFLSDSDFLETVTL